MAAASSSSSSSSSSMATPASAPAPAGDFASFTAQLDRTNFSDDALTRPHTIAVFERHQGDFYTSHGATALYVADKYFNTREIVKQGGENQDLPYVNLRPQRVATLVKEAVADNLSVQILRKESGEWKIIKQASPGDLQGMEEFVFGSAQMNDTPVGMAIHMCPSTATEELQLGVSFVDTTMRTLQVCEFSEDRVLSNLRALLQQQSPKECVVSQSLKADKNAEGGAILDLLSSQGVKVHLCTASHFSGDSIEQDLRRLVGSTHQHFQLLERKTAMGALAAQMKHLQLLRDDSGFGKYRISSYDLSQYMRLDTSATKALHMFVDKDMADKSMYLYGVLNRGQTAAGSRLLTRWMKQPLLDVKEIERRQDLVELFLNDHDLRTSLLSSHLRGVPDLSRMSRQFERKQGKLELIVALYKFIIRLPGLASALSAHEGPNKAVLEPKLQALQSIISKFRKLEALVEACVDLEALRRREYLINAKYDEALAQLGAEKIRLMDRIDDVYGDVAADLKLTEYSKKEGKTVIKRLYLQSLPQLGYHLRVTRKDESLIRNKKEYLTLETRKDGVRFTTVRLKQLASRYQECSSRYSQAQQVIVDKCVEVVASFAPVMEELADVLAELDVLVGFAEAAASAPTPYVRPKMLPKGSGLIRMKDCRHPCMELQRDVHFIANNVEMKKGETNVQVITGPNMGGKSTFIRQVGLLTVMAQIGSFIPCTSADISVVDCILARVGAGDSQLRGVSTFMKEMLEASAILRASSANSLLIVDELGRGTSTYDGFGLAWAIAEHLAREVGAFTLFATHFHELTALADVAPSVVNRHVTAHTDDNSITMLYKVNPGPCDRSFGIHVSELAKFPVSVVAMAKRKAYQLETFGSKAELCVLEEDEKQGGAGQQESESDKAEKRRKVVLKSQAFAHQLETPEKRMPGVSAEEEKEVQSLLSEFAAVPLEQPLPDPLLSRLLAFQSSAAGTEPAAKQQLAMPSAAAAAAASSSAAAPMEDV